MGEYIQSPHGLLYREGTDVHLKSKGGERFVAATPEQAKRLLDSGEMIPASAEDVAQRMAQNRSGGTAGEIRSAAEGAAAGAMDVTLAIPKLATSAATAAGVLERDPLADVSGRGAMAAASGLIAEARGGELGVAERQAREGMRERAQVNPWSSGAGYLAGSVAPTLGMGAALGLGRGIGAVAASGAIEGAVQGAAQASEDSFVQDYELTAERLWAGAGMGAALGAGVNVGLAGAGRLRSVFGRGPGKVSGKAPAIPSAEDIGASVAKLTGETPSPGVVAKVRDAIESLQGAAVGASDEEMGVLRKHGALRRDPEAFSGRELYHRRSEIIRDSSDEIATGINEIQQDVATVLDDAVSGRARLKRLEQLVGNENTAEQLRAARMQVGRLRQMNQELTQLEQAQAAPSKPRQATVSSPPTNEEKLADAIRYVGGDSGGAVSITKLRSRLADLPQNEFDDALRKLQEGNEVALYRNDNTPSLTSEDKRAAFMVGDQPRHIVYAKPGLRRAPSAVEEVSQVAEPATAGSASADKMYGNKLPRNRLVTYIESVLDGIDNKTSAAESYWALDEVKRAIDKEVVGLRGAAKRTPGRGPEMQAYSLADKLESVANDTRASLEDKVWGNAATWQKEKNAAWVEFIKTRMEFSRALTRQVEGKSYETGAGVYLADPAKVQSFVEGLGTNATKMPEEYIRRHIAATRRLTEAVARGGDPEKFAEPMRQIARGYDAIEAALGKADKTVKVANLIDSVVKKERESVFGSVLGGAAIGGMVGGPLGAAVGAAVGGVVRPGTLLRQAAAVEALGRKVTERMDGSIANFLRKHSGTSVADSGADKATRVKIKLQDLPEFGGSAKKLAKEGADAARMFGEQEAAKFALPGKSDRDSYKERARQLRELADGTKVIEWAASGFGELAAAMPNTYSHAVGKAAWASQYLLSKLPQATTDPDLQRIGVVPASDELHRFRKAWEAVMNPFSILDQLDSGYVDPVSVEAFRAVYPRQWEDLKQRTLLQLTALEEPPPINTRLQLDLLFDMGGIIEPSISSKRLANNLLLAQLRQKQAEPQAPPKPSSSQPDIASMYKTRTESIQ